MCSDLFSYSSEPYFNFSIVCGRRSEPYDPYLPRNGSSSTPAAGPSQGNSKTAAIQAQIDDTVGIMRENITKVAERGERLEALQDKTGARSIFAASWSLRTMSVRPGSLFPWAFAFVIPPSANARYAAPDKLLTLLVQITSLCLPRASGAEQTVYAK